MLWERARARGLSGLRGWLRVWGAQKRSSMRATGTPELRERSASAPQSTTSVVPVRSSAKGHASASVV
eukprot:6184930-Pleurochrysis_carterae.AAC.4